MHPKRRQDGGFTLTELMITVLVVVLLGAIAYPRYTAQLQKSRRAAAQTTLLELAARQIEWRSRHTRYGGLAELLALPPAIADPSNHHYAYDVSAGSVDFAISATPTGPQTSDRCGRLQLAQDLGGSPADCW